MKVTPVLQDRINTHARSEHVTRQWFAQIKAAYEQTPATADEQAEIAAWDVTLSDGLEKG